VLLRRLPVFFVVALTIGAPGCSSDENPAGDAGRFCGEVEANAAELTNPDLAFSDDIDPLLGLYRKIGEFAPLAIEPDWQQLIKNYETASTVVPGDDESEQRMIESALRTEKSAVAVSRWLKTNCDVDLGPVDTIAAQI
jgi:hypothetical protein